jgi:hypothetical protein
MSETAPTPTKAELAAAKALDEAKVAANKLGIAYNPNIGLATLQAKITEHIVNQPLPSPEPSETPAAAPKKVTPKSQTPSVAELKLRKENQIRREARRLTRVVVQCMNPNKKDWDGEIFTVSSGVAGTVKRFVPFNNMNGWHIEKIVLDHLKEREYQFFRPKKMPGGRTIIENILAPEFQIAVLPPLTKEEIHELKEQQALNRSIDR